jgi:hypothetical protein
VSGPGHLSSKQRGLIMEAHEFEPLVSHRIRVGDWQALNGLIQRGIFAEIDPGCFYLTDDGKAVAAAIERLRKDGGLSIFDYLSMTRGEA